MPTMSNSTDDNLVERQEQLTREYLDVLRPHLEQLVDAIVTPRVAEYDNFARDSQAQLRSDVTSWTKDLATKQEVRDQAKQYADAQFAPLQDNWQSLLKDFNQERERTQAMIAQQQQVLDQKIERMLELAQSAETRSIANEIEIAALKATGDHRYEQVQKDIASIRRDVDTNVKSMLDAANRMDVTFAKFVERSEKRLDKIEQTSTIVAREVSDLQSARTRFEKRIEEALDDTGNIRQDVDGLRSDIATKVTTTDLKVKHIDSELSEIKQRQSNQSAETEVLKKWVIDIQVQLKSALWLLNTWAGRTILATILALLGISNLVS
jgi:Holliday junction resolvase RusA-like endonuclease